LYPAGIRTAAQIVREFARHAVIALDASVVVELLGRIWELPHNFTGYDAAYMALAEATNSVLYQ
jgi:predicted nucleic acid-binding protein